MCNSYSLSSSNASRPEPEAIARSQTQALQAPCEHRARGVQFRVGPAPVAGDQSWTIGVPAPRLLEELGDVHGISRTLPVVFLASSARCASAASFNGNS